MPKAPGKYADPLEELKERGPRPLYVVDGEERLLVDEAVKTIKQYALPKNARDFNFDSFSGRSTPLMRILEAAETMPAFAPRRVVLVEHADELDLDAGDGDEGNASEKKERKRRAAAAFLDYLAKPSPTTVLVFVGDKFDARTKVYKAFQKAGVVLRYSRPKPREMPDLVRNRARAHGIAIDEHGIRALCDTVGTDATSAFQALELLALYVGPGSGQTITADDVESLISETREESIFALADAIGSRDRAAALRGLHSMIAVSREHPLRILAMIARHWRNLARARSLMDAGVPRGDIQQAVGIPPFFLDNLLGQAKRQPVTAFVSGLEAISRVDRELKGGALGPARAMERLVLGLMGDEAHRDPLDPEGVLVGPGLVVLSSA